MDFDFSFFLALASLVTGCVWGGYVLMLRMHPPEPPPEKEPLLVEYARSFFPIVFIVLILRSFLVEPFRIPSGSMMPTLLVGDFILVNKYTYGIRLPVVNLKIVEMGQPLRGDIVVFRYPKDPGVDYIKRIIGLPGDRVSYFNKQVHINGKPVPQTPLGFYEGEGHAHLLSENLLGVEHDILMQDGRITVNDEFIVPEGQFFVMGDNRDNSNDSRYWGTVPEANLVGKAFFIWMSWNWSQGGVVFNRLGTLLK